jgi:CBS domain-containing protein
MDARDIMTRDVIAVAPDMLVDEVADLLMRHRIHGAPVVDSDTNQLVGMISFVDLVGRRGQKVRDVMASEPVSASEDTPMEEISAMMLDQMVRRVPVVRGGRVVGIVSAGDIIQLFLNLHEASRTVAEEDQREVARGRAGRR